MASKNIVFIGKSLDGFIADKSGSLDWLHAIPNPNNHQMGYDKFIKNVDAIVMGRTTFETSADLTENGLTMFMFSY
ncbi:hypothetical protein N8085_02035 [Salibacteraceae bacterium]|jgi:dihydrofolate reductase|nr:hypothetical protein [Salibacteraceae bacterium]